MIGMCGRMGRGVLIVGGLGKSGGSGRMKGLGGLGSFGKGIPVKRFARVFPITSTPSVTGFLTACTTSPIPVMSSIPKATSLALLQMSSLG
jgi:hypothetical protein